MVHPATKALSLFASIPRNLSGCPGGTGLTTAMAILKSGWVIVGSLPSQDGTTATKGQGCLIVLDDQGHVARTITIPLINGPWGNMAVMDHDTSALLFVSNTGFGIEAPGQDIVRKANIVRLEFSIPTGAPPQLVQQTVIADGFGEQANQDVFIIGPTGLALAGLGTQQALAATRPSAAASSMPAQATEPFWGHHQGGIITPHQGQTYFVAFDRITDKVTAVVKLLQSWTQAAALMTSGASGPAYDEQDSLEALGLPGARLPLTFGFGAGLFVQNGKDRFGLAAYRPPALIDLPRFNGDQLEPLRTGGDISVQACADDPQIVFHAIRHLARLAKGTARLR